MSFSDSFKRYCVGTSDDRVRYRTDCDYLEIIRDFLKKGVNVVTIMKYLKDQGYNTDGAEIQDSLASLIDHLSKLNIMEETVLESEEKQSKKKTTRKKRKTNAKSTTESNNIQ